MGRGRKQWNKKGKGPANGDADEADPRALPGGNTGVWNAYDKKSALFEEYYRGQGILEESEWPAFLEALQRDLPTTFRVTGSRAHAQAINDIITSTYVPKLTDLVIDPEAAGDPGVTTPIALPPPFQLPWYPSSFAWQISAPKRYVRKLPAFREFQRFLVGETEIGNISRQEAVSMIPPLLLDVRPEHVCLDMCAAPGSKTAQIIEFLNPSTADGSVPPGLLIANDSDAKRCHMLVHQTGRLPSVGLGVTNWDASAFPTIRLDARGTPLRFDRILADVPCTGDGTMRKNADIWGNWQATQGASLHPLQHRILVRAMTMLKPGGRMVYSTCSFNPLENEAVVAAGLRSFPAGEFEIVPQGEDVLPHLKRRPGLTRWKVATQRPGTKELVWHDSAEAYRIYGDEWKQTQVGRKKAKGEGIKDVADTCWPPANADTLGLEGALRLVPHDQDTGGFFVCVIERKGTPNQNETTVLQAAVAGKPQPPKRALSPSAESSASAEKKARVDAAVEATLAQDVAPEEAPAASTPAVDDAQASKDSSNQWKEDPFHFLPVEDPELKSCFDFFAIKDTFPKANCMVRNKNGQALRSIYVCNNIMKAIVQHNDIARLRMISAGIRIFLRQDSNNKLELACKWRIPAEGLQSLVGHVDPARIDDAGLGELRVFLENSYPIPERFGQAFQERIKERPMGCHLVRFAAGEDAGGKLQLPLLLPIWKSTNSYSLMADKKEKSMLSLRTFGEDICNFTPSGIKTAKTEPGPAEASTAAATPMADEEESVPAAAGVGAAEEAAIDEEAQMNGEV